MKRHVNLPYKRKKSPNTEKSHLSPDMTIPGESYSLRDLVKKHQLGMMPPIERQAIWQEDANHDDIDLNKVHSMDIVEKREIAARQESHLNRLKQEQEVSRPNREGAADVTEGSVADRRNVGEVLEDTTANPVRKTMENP